MDTVRTAYSYLRFSTPEQSQGASKARQSDSAVAYCKAHGLHLDTTLHLNDEGISAFRGKNVKVGALGRFLAAAEAGRIPHGSLLLIENLDRLSRENVDDALDLFRRILKLGIDIATLCNDRTYTQETLKKDPWSLMEALTIMWRANEESETKSKRIADAWARKRKNTHDHKALLTHVIPAWLRYDDAKEQFYPIPERVKVLKQIFDFASDGHGKDWISRELNKRKIPAFCGRTWSQMSVAIILHNRALIGEFQPRRRENDKRVPVGDPIPSYFPTVIDPTVFHYVQNHRRSPLKGPREHNGMVHNLFSGRLSCGYCGASMHYVDKSKHQYLVCAEAKKGVHPYLALRYDEFQESFLGLCRDEVNIPRLFNDKASQALAKNIADLQKSITGAEATIADNRARTRRLMSQFADTANRELRKNYDDLMTELTAETEALSKSVVEKKEELTRLKTTQGTINEMVKTVADAYGEDDRIKHDHELRARIRNVISDIVDEIAVFAGGANRSDTVDRLFAFLKKKPLSGSVPAETDKSIRCYAVRFKNGATTRMSLMAPDKRGAKA